MPEANHEVLVVKRPRELLLVGIVLAVSVGQSVVLGEEDRAAARLEAMASFLARTPRLSVTIDSAYDVVQESGQKVQFGERRGGGGRRPAPAAGGVAPGARAG